MRKNNPNYFAIIPANVRYDQEISANAKLLFGEITALTNQDGYCWANNMYFSKLYQVDSRSVQRWLSELVKGRYIFIEYIDQKRRIFIMDEGVTKMSLPHDKNVTPPHDKIVTHNNTSINNTINKSININFDKLKDQFVEITGKRIRVVSDKVKREIRNRLKEGYSKEDLINTMKGVMKSDHHKESGFKWVTLEFISRSTTIDKYCDQGEIEEKKDEFVPKIKKYSK